MEAPELNAMTGALGEMTEAVSEQVTPTESPSQVPASKSFYSPEPQVFAAMQEAQADIPQAATDIAPTDPPVQTPYEAMMTAHEAMRQYESQNQQVFDTIQACLDAENTNESAACLSEQLGIPLADVQRNYSALKAYSDNARAQSALGDIKTQEYFVENYPYETRLILERPELTPVVVNRAGWWDAISAGWRFMQSMVGAQKKILTDDGRFPGEKLKEYVSERKTFTDDFQKSITKNEQVNVPKASAEAGGPLAAWKAGRLDVEDAELGRRMAAAIQTNDKSEQARLRYLHERNRTKRAQLVPEHSALTVSGTLTDALASVPGTLDVLKWTAGAGIIGAGAGTLVSPGLGTALGFIGSTAATYNASQSQQYGSTVWDYLNVTTDDGQKLRPKDAVRAANTSARIGAVIESADALFTFATLGGGKLLSKGAGAGAKSAVKAAALEATTLGGAVLRGGLSEAAEEVSQQVVQDVIELDERAKRDFHAQRVNYHDVANKLLQTGVVSFAAGAGFTGVPYAGRSAWNASKLGNFLERIGKRAEKEQAKQDAVTTAAQLAAIAREAAKMPPEVREVVAPEVARRAQTSTGESLSVLHLDAVDVVNFFAQDGKDAAAELTQALGEKFAGDVLESSRTGQPVRISLTRFVHDFASLKNAKGETLAEALAPRAWAPGSLSLDEAAAMQAGDDELDSLIDAVLNSDAETTAEEARLKAKVAEEAGLIEGAEKFTQEATDKARAVRQHIYDGAVAAGLSEEDAAVGADYAARLALKLAINTGDVTILESIEGTEIQGASTDMIADLARIENAQALAEEAGKHGPKARRFRAKKKAQKKVQSEIMNALGAQNTEAPQPPVTPSDAPRIQEQQQAAPAAEDDGEETLTMEEVVRHLFQDVRGATTIPDDAKNKFYGVLFGGKADASTIIHEAAHIVLDSMAKTSIEKTATPELKQAFDGIASWLGIQNNKPTRQQQEQFAEQLESFLATNEAELGEETLPALEYAREFLRATYQTADTLGAKLTPDAISEFTRLFAGDDIIKSASSQAVSEMMSSALEFTQPGGIEDYLKRMEKSAKETSRSHVFDEVRRQLRELDALKKETIEKEYKKALDEIKTNDAYIFKRSMRTGEIDGINFGKWKLNRKELLEVFGTDRVPIEAAGMTATDGFTYDEVTVYLPGAGKFKSRDEFYFNMVLAPWDAEKAARAEAKKRVEEKAGEIFRQKQAEIQALAEKASFTPSMANEIFTALKKLNNSAPARRDIETGVAKYIDGSKYSALHYKSWSRAVIHAHRNVLSALTPGKRGQSGANRALAGHWQQRLAYAYTVARGIIEEQARFRRDVTWFKRFTAKESERRKAVGRTDARALDVLDSVLESIGFKKEPEDKAIVQARSSLEEFRAAFISEHAQGRNLEDGDGTQDAALWHWNTERLNNIIKSKVAFKDLTVGDQKYITAFAKWLYSGRAGVTVQIDGEAMTLQEAAQKLAAQVPNTGRKNYADPNLKQLLRKVQDGVEPWFWKHIETKALLERLGPYGIRIWDTLTRGDEEKQVLADKIIARWKDIQAKNMASWSRRAETVPLTHGLELPSDLTALSRQNAIVAALNVGNDSNMQRLCSGMNGKDGQTWTPEAVMGWLDDVLTPEDWDFVQAIWDMLDQELYPHVAKAYRTTQGIPLGRVPARAFSTKDGRNFRGGYFPISYDPSASRVGSIQEITARREVEDFAASVRDGFTKSRAQKVVAQRLDLNISRLIFNIQKQVHYATHEVPTHDVNALLNSNELMGAIKDAFGKDYYNLLKYTLRVYANGIPRDVGASPLMDAAKNSMVVGSIGGSFPAAVGEVVRVPTAVLTGRVGLKHALYALTHVRDAIHTAQEKSPEWRLRTSKNHGRILSDDVLEKIEYGTFSESAGQAGARFRHKTAELMFALLDFFTWFNSAIMFSAKYSEAISNNLTEKDAIREGDHAIQDFFQEVMDWRKPQIQNSFWYKIATVFAGEGIKLASIFYRTRPDLIIQDINGREWKQLVKRITGVLGVLVFYPLASLLLMGRGPRKDEDKAEWAIKNIALTAGGYDPKFLTPVANISVALYERKRMQGFRLPVETIIDSMVKGGADLAGENSTPAQRVVGALNLFGPLAAMPTHELNRIMKPMMDAPGQDPVEDVPDFIEAVLYGRNSQRGWNPLMVINGPASGRSARKGASRQAKKP